jgi:hypothetical protein
MDFIWKEEKWGGATDKGEEEKFNYVANVTQKLTVNFTEVTASSNQNS